jgi:ABC-type bacteriocin/lantibiotic exporter with double-glycine peptidase domain
MKRMKYYLIQSFVRQHFFRLLIIIGLGVANSLAGIILLLSVGKYLEIVFTSGSTKSRALSWLGIHLSNELSSFFFFFFVVAAIKFFCSWAEKYYSSIISALLLARARKQYFQYLLHENGKKTVPKQLVWFSSELKALQRYFEKGVIGFIKDIFFFLVCLYLLMRFSLTPALLLLLIVVLLLIAGRYGHKPLKKISIDQRKKTAALLSFISVRLHTIDDIQQKKAGNKVYFQFLRRQKNVLCTQYKMWFYKTLISSLVPLASLCG